MIDKRNLTYYTKTVPIDGDNANMSFVKANTKIFS